MKMTARKILALVPEYEAEYAKAKTVLRHSVVNGKVLRSTYKSLEHTERYLELDKIMRTEKVFRCSECGEMCAYCDLDPYYSTFSEKSYVCKVCGDECEDGY